jgi:hypothetical protein
MNTDPRYGNNFLDNNALDRIAAPEDEAMEQVLALADAGEFTLLLPYSVRSEIEHPKTPPEVRRKAEQLPYSIRVGLTALERATHEKIRTLIRGNAQLGQHDQDAFHLVESAKNGGRYFITNDNRLLNKSREIYRALRIEALKPSAFLAGFRAYANGR